MKYLGGCFFWLETRYIGPKSSSSIIIVLEPWYKYVGSVPHNILEGKQKFNIQLIPNSKNIVKILTLNANSISIDMRYCRKKIKEREISLTEVKPSKIPSFWKITHLQNTKLLFFSNFQQNSYFKIFFAYWILYSNKK